MLKDTSRSDLNVRHFLPFIRNAAARCTADDSAPPPCRYAGGLERHQRRPARHRKVRPARLAHHECLAHVDAGKDRRQGGSRRSFDKWYMASGYETTQDGPAGSLNLSTGSKVLCEALLRASLAGHSPARGPVWRRYAGRRDSRRTGRRPDIAKSAKYGDDIARWQPPAVDAHLPREQLFRHSAGGRGRSHPRAGVLEPRDGE
ncbi:hypothetical protein ACU4GD_19150 [Cupriavidus basilensis]